MEQQAVVAPELKASIGSSPRVNLPIPPTPLIGREWELAAALTLLTGVKVRLLTITGPGGVGKTRISLQIGTLLAEHFADGVHFVSLAPISDPSTVISTIASSLGIRDDSARPLLDRLKNFIARKRLLLILDNFEQIVPAGPLVVELLAAAAELKVIVTSRAALRVRGEQEFPLSPLPLPELKEGIELKEEAELETIRKSESVALFEQAAQGVRPDFSITPENAATIAEICARVDGLPLAIELAAARMRILSPKDILERLSNRFGLLTGGPRDLPTRQQTLHNAIEWSFDLLEERERRLFRRLAVFRGGCTLDAVETICRMPDDPPMEILDLLTSLIDKSMIRQHEDGNGDAHFTMLESIREFAREQLDLSGETDTMFQRHMEYYARLSAVAGKELYGWNQPKWTRRIDAEHDNMRQALEWAFAHDDTESAYTLVTSLTKYWVIRGQLRYALARLEKLVAFGEKLEPRKLGAALNQYGSMAWTLADFPLAMEIFEKSKTILDEVNDTDNLARVYNNLANCLTNVEEYDRAKEYYLKSMEIRQGTTKESAGLTTSIIGLGNIAHIQGDPEKAKEYYHQSLAIGREAGDRDAMILSLMNLGVCLYMATELEGSKEHLTEALDLAREGYNLKGMMMVLPNLAQAATEMGDNALALRSHMEALGIAEEIDHPDVMTLNQCVGQVYANMGECSKAAPYFRKALGFHMELEGTEEDLVKIIGDIGYMTMRAGRNETAVKLLAATEEAWGERLRKVIWPQSLRCYTDALGSARTALGEEAFETIAKRARGMAMQQVIDEALRVLDEIEPKDISVGPVAGTWNAPAEENTVSREGQTSPSTEAPAPQESHTHNGGTRPPSAPYPNDLTMREVEVLRLVAEGLTDAEAGEKLFISTRTVNAHLRSIYSKLGVTTRTDASKFAKEKGLVD